MHCPRSPHKTQDLSETTLQISKSKEKLQTLLPSSPTNECHLRSPFEKTYSFLGIGPDLLESLVHLRPASSTLTLPVSAVGWLLDTLFYPSLGETLSRPPAVSDPVAGRDPSCFRAAPAGELPLWRGRSRWDREAPGWGPRAQAVLGTVPRRSPLREGR